VQPRVADEADVARHAQLAQQRAVGGQERVAAEQHVDAGREELRGSGSAEQEPVRGRAPHHRCPRGAQPLDPARINADGVHGEQIVRHETAGVELAHLVRRRAVDAFREVDGERRAVGRRWQDGREPERMRRVDPDDAQREVLVERVFPRVVMHHRRHAGAEILPRAAQQRLAPRHRAPERDRLGEAMMDVVPPLVRVLVRRMSETTVVIAVQMVVRVDQAGEQRTVPHAQRGVEPSRRRDDASLLDAERRVARLDQQSHAPITPPA